MTYKEHNVENEVTMKYDNVEEKLIQKPFEVVIKLLPGRLKEFLVFIDDEFLTTYESKGNITETEYIGFTPGLRVCASEIKI